MRRNMAPLMHVVISHPAKMCRDMRALEQQTGARHRSGGAPGLNASHVLDALLLTINIARRAHLFR